MSKNLTIEEIKDICAAIIGCELKDNVQAKQENINKHSLSIFLAAQPLAWESPTKIEKEIDGIIRDIRKLRKRISALDGYAASLARRHAQRHEEQAINDAIVASAQDPEKLEEALKQFDEFSTRPKELWVDFAALAHLDALEQALIKPAEVAIAASPPGAGRRPNRRAYRVALATARAFRDLTGENPTFWNGGETPFSRMLAEIYRSAGIKADLRKPIEAAMHELSSYR
jgi:hypothetical protein